MNILITGASGLIGSALNSYFEGAGHRVIPLVRDSSGAAFTWQPEKDVINLDESVDIDVVINLAGPGVADKRWSETRKKELLEARVHCTELLSKTLAQRDQKPSVFISASAIGFYGPRDDQPVDEFADSGSGFLAEISRQWEAATAAAEAAGIRSVHTRFGIVLAADGGALKRMLLPFRLGLGGPIGSGRQYMSWITLDDVVRAVEFVIQDDNLRGPVNLVAPGAVDNREFTRTLGRVLKRPAFIPMPGFQARLLFGEMAEEILLTGVRVKPARLQQAGFHFRSESLEEALRSMLG
ncbi:MAG: TIGR01777 family oxidoreductase [Gammaproteobacteria bacterium]